MSDYSQQLMISLHCLSILSVQNLGGAGREINRNAHLSDLFDNQKVSLLERFVKERGDLPHSK
jgi:hypothetical protein